MNAKLQKWIDIINDCPPCDGNQAQLAHALSEAVDMLDSIESQGAAQIRAGDTHITISRNMFHALFIS